MMILTPQAVAHFRSTIAEKEMTDDELRRVKALGNLFVSKKRFVMDGNGELVTDTMIHWFLYTLKIDGVKYHFYGGENVVPNDE